MTIYCNGIFFYVYSTNRITKNDRLKNMKKALLSMVAVAIASSAMMTATTANAAIEIEPRAYVGVDYKYFGQIGEEVNKAFDAPADAKISDSYANALGLTAGVQLNDFVGVEASYARTVKNFSAIDGVSLNAETLSVGVTGQYPIADQFYAKALIGSTWGRLNAKADDAKVYDTTDATFLGKVGVGYQVSDKTVVELTYNRELDTDGLGLQYKVLF